MSDNFTAHQFVLNDFPCFNQKLLPFGPHSLYVLHTLPHLHFLILLFNYFPQTCFVCGFLKEV